MRARQKREAEEVNKIEIRKKVEEEMSKKGGR